MAISKRVKRNAQDLIAAGMLVLAIGGGAYMVDETRVTEDMEFIEVGWWNIRDLGTSRDDDEIAQIAKVMTGPDVFAIGELNDRTALERIAHDLGSSWSWAATHDKVGHTAGSREYYGFLWNTTLVAMDGNVHVDADPGDKIDREPAWATFRTVDGNFDFTVMAVHITWGDNAAARKEEVELMADVWERTQDATPDDDDMILVGDFNRNVGDDAFDRLKSIPDVICANEDTGPTVVKGTSTYDQIFLSLAYTQEWTGEYMTRNFDKTMFHDDDAAASKAVSDHRPVWVTLYVPEGDDD